MVVAGLPRIDEALALEKRTKGFGWRLNLARELSPYRGNDTLLFGIKSLRFDTRAISVDGSPPRRAHAPSGLSWRQPGLLMPRIRLSNLARQLKYMTNRVVAIPPDPSTIPNALIPFTSPPFDCALGWPWAHTIAQCAFKLEAEKLELTRRHSEALPVGHDAVAVEQDQDSILSVQQRINLFVDPLHVTTKRLSKGHDSTLPI